MTLFTFFHSENGDHSKQKCVESFFNWLGLPLLPEICLFQKLVEVYSKVTSLSIFMQKIHPQLVFIDTHMYINADQYKKATNNPKAQKWLVKWSATNGNQKISDTEILSLAFCCAFICWYLFIKINFGQSAQLILKFEVAQCQLPRHRSLTSWDLMKIIHAQ